MISAEAWLQMLMLACERRRPCAAHHSHAGLMEHFDKKQIKEQTQREAFKTPPSAPPPPYNNSFPSRVPATGATEAHQLKRNPPCGAYATQLQPHPSWISRLTHVIIAGDDMRRKGVLPPPPHHDVGNSGTLMNSSKHLSTLI